MAVNVLTGKRPFMDIFVVFF